MPPTESKRIRGPVLVVVGLALIAIVAVVLVSLHDPLRHQAVTDENGSGEGSAASPAAGPASPRSPALPARAARPAQPVKGTGAGSGSAASAVPAPAPSKVRVEGTGAIPSEIVNETDPVKKAELLKMHKLTTARVRLSMLRRRRQLLHQSLDEARRLKTWSAEKVSAAERQLEEIGAAVGQAEENLNQVREEVGGDIDKGAR